MILGERQMYQDDWIKIKQRLDKGESFLVILEEVMKPNTQAVMQMARETVIAVSEEWNKIVLSYITSLPEGLLKLVGIDVNLLEQIGGTDVSRVKDFSVPSFHNLPSPEETQTDKLHREKLERQKKSKATIQRYTQVTFDQSIVGSGHSRAQIMVAIKRFETIIKNSWRNANNYRTTSNQPGQDRTNLIRLFEKTKNLIKVYEKSLAEYKKALSWLNSQGRTGVKTP